MANFAQSLSEKVERLKALMGAIGSAREVRDRLSLCGGTALNLLRESNPPRLSEDLDFNFRHTGKGEWGMARGELETDIKQILESLGYGRSSVKIQPRYNQGRFFLNYHDKRDNRGMLKIEIGYMRRIPDLPRETYLQIPSVGGGVRLRTPALEELYANKFATMFSRMRKQPNARDVFDVATISMRHFDYSRFVDIVMLETILMDMSRKTMTFRFSGKAARRELEALAGHEVDMADIQQTVESFSSRVMDDLDDRDILTFQRSFINDGVVRRDMLRTRLHPKVESHPQLLWLKMKNNRA